MKISWKGQEVHDENVSNTQTLTLSFEHQKSTFWIQHYETLQEYMQSWNWLRKRWSFFFSQNIAVNADILGIFSLFSCYDIFDVHNSIKTGSKI